MQHPLWDYRQDDWSGRDLVGYHVLARDGAVGKVDAATDAVDMSCLVIDTGPWIFGKKVVIPVGLVDEIDDSTHSVVVDRTTEEIKQAPTYEDELFYDESYREELGAHYLTRDRDAAAPWDRGETA